MLNVLNLFGKRTSARDRRFPRIAIETRAELFFVDRKYAIPGMVIELSRGGALFREASRYILDRKDAAVVLRIGRYDISGVIVNVRPNGYGILFEAPLSEDAMAELTGQFADAVD